MTVGRTLRASALNAVTGALTRRFPSVEWVDATALQRVETRDGLRVEVVIDVRSEAEFELGHLPGARHLDPAGDPDRVPWLRELERDVPIVVYCSLGYRSGRMAERIQALGFERVRNLAGGIFGWANLGFEIATPAGEAGRVHPYASPLRWLLEPERRAELGDPDDASD